MKLRSVIIAAFAAATALISCKSADDYGYTIKDNKIVYNTPPRPADQQSMLGFAAEPIEHVRVGLIGLGDRGTGAVERFPFLEDATIVATHMMLAAADAGLDSCWINCFDPDQLAEALNLPENEEVLMLLDLGYAAEDAGPLANHHSRKPLEETVSYL